MDSFNSCGQENVLRMNRSAILKAMIQKRETLMHVKREMAQAAQLVEKEKQIEEDLACLDAALAACNVYVFPNEILHRIFVLLVQEHGPVDFPISSKTPPPQLAISHVCSSWRGAALQTTKLWNNAHLKYSEKNPSLHTVRILQLWLLRSRHLPVTLSINWMFSKTHGTAYTLQKLIRSFRVKKLCLKLPSDRFLDLSLCPDNALSTLSETELDILIDGALPDGIRTGPRHFISQLQSLVFPIDSSYEMEWLDKLSPNIPWSQLRRLEFRQLVDELRPIFDVLRQMPVLRRLRLTICDSHISEFNMLQDHELIMGSLQDLDLDLDKDIADSDSLNKVLRSFICLSLTDLRLNTSACWTEDTIDILRHHYNIQRLENVHCSGFASPVSSMLQEAPMLRSLYLGWNAIMDDDAFSGISNGTLGRFLKRLNVYAGTFVGDVLSMVEARKKLVDELFESGYSWREEISVLRHVTMIHAKSKNEYEERVVALQAAGITITFSK